MKIRNRSALLVAVLLIGIGAAAFAISGQETNAANSASGARARQQTKAPASHISEKARDDEDEEENEAPLVAKITPDAAKEAALAIQPGTVTKVELENEDGRPVYGVDIMATGGGKFDVKVDGNTGKVVKSEADDEGAEREDSERETK